MLDNCEHLLDGVRPPGRATADRAVRASSCWPPAGPGCGCPSSSCSRCRGCRSRDGERATADQSDATALFRRAGADGGLVVAVPRRPPPDRGHLPPSWTGWRWRSSWPPPGWRPSASTGWTGGLADPLGLLAGGPRMDQRHRSLRAVLDWSFGLLSTDEQAVIRRASVFASPFTAAAAADGRGLRAAHAHRGGARPRQPGRPQPAGGGRRTVRHPLPDARDDPAVRRRADGPRRRAGRRTSPTPALVPGDRDPAAVRWRYRRAVRRGGRRPAGRAAAGRPADRRCMPTPTSSPCGWRSSPTRRGKPSEAQERYEEAAALAADPAEAAQALHLGAAVAWGRHAGNEAIRLYRAAAEAARRAGDPRRAAVELATAAEVITNAPGIMSELAAAWRGVGAAGGGPGAGRR